MGVTRLGPGVRPLARTTIGIGNGDGTEGCYTGQVVGTYLHGPALARNPGAGGPAADLGGGRPAPADRRLLVRAAPRGAADRGAAPLTDLASGLTNRARRGEAVVPRACP